MIPIIYLISFFQYLILMPYDISDLLHSEIKDLAKYGIQGLFLQQTDRLALMEDLDALADIRPSMYAPEGVLLDNLKGRFRAQPIATDISFVTKSLKLFMLGH